ncbi:hypothetical protein H0H92_000455 [Tricholoma furcatifolium]|nr:hypothetical protein H0H92_000455 [Tricholoma furcatifolium]
MVPGAFSIILPKGTQVRETEKFNKPYLRVHESILDVDAKVNCGVLCYRGSNADPKWLDEDPQMYSKLCYVSAEAPPATKHLNRKGKYYYKIKFDVVLNFGLTELTAQIQWLDSSGEQQRSPAQIIYDEIAEEIGL